MTVTLPIKRTIRRHQGDTWDSWSIIWKQSGVAVDLTGYTATLTLNSVEGGATVATLTSTDGELTLDEAAGKVTLSVPFATTALIPSGRHYYDLAVDDGTTKKTLTLGDFIVTDDAR